MALVILKKTRQHAVVRATGAATHTITLLSLSADNQALSADQMVVNIRGIKWSVPAGGTAKITRNAVDVMEFGPGWGSLEYNGFSDNENATSNIVVTITGNSTVILDLAKVAGYDNVSVAFQTTEQWKSDPTQTHLGGN